MATAKKADIKIKNTNFTGDDGKLIYPRAHYDHLDGKPTSYPPTTHNHTVDEIEGLQDVLSRYSVWEDTGETLYVRTGDGIADLDVPYNTILGSRIFATDIEAEVHEPSGSDKYALVTGFKWVSSTITEYNSTQGQWDITASFGRTPTVAEVNHLVIPTYDLYDHGQSNLVLKILDTEGGSSYWKLVPVDTTFQGNPKIYESVIANAARPTWNQVTNKPAFAPVDAQKNSDITKAEIEAKLKGEITSHSHALPAHTHTKSQITDFPTAMPPTAHNHDDRYYTETEVDTKLAGKANTTHTHTKSEITDFPTTMAPTAHTHTKSEITDFPTSMPPTAHTHDDRYYTESEVDTKLTGKANTTHTHTKSQITDFPTTMPPTAHEHTIDEIEGLQDVLSRYSVWEDIEERLYVRTGDGIADLDVPYNTILGSHIFATDIEAEANEPSGSGNYALVTGFKWVSSNSSEYNSTQGQWDITASFGRTPTVAEVNHLVIPTYDLYDHGQSNLVLKISDTEGGISYWKLVPVDTTFQGNPKVYESVIANAARPTWNQVTNKPTFATVATSGSYNDLSNKPSIPAAQVQSDWNATTGMGVIKNKPTIPAAQVASNWNSTSGVTQILNKPNLATVATSGSYNDLEDKLVAGDNITIDPTTNMISASGGEVDPNAMAYFDYAGNIYGAKYSLLASAWEHSLTVDPSKISATSSSSNYQGRAQYPNGASEGVIIPQGVTSIGQYAFYGWTTNNQPLVIPNSVTSIGTAAFYNWSANSHPLVIPSSVTTIGTNAFYIWSANNQPLVISNSVTSIGTAAFYNWSANNQPLVIPNSVTYIGTNAFSYWSANSHPLVIPSSVTNIGTGAFNNWFLVPYVEMKRTAPPGLSSASAFSNQNNVPIYVPDGSVNAYKTATNWVSLADRIFPISDKPDLMYDIADLQENKQDKLVAGENITIDENNVISASGASDASGGNYIEINYADLVVLRDSNSLKEGAFYRIMDYETTTVQAETRSAGHLFDIIVQALDEKTLSENASAIHKKAGGPSWFEHDQSDPAERFFYVDSVVIAGLTLYRWLSEEEIIYDSNPQYMLTDTRDVGIGDIVWGYQTIDEGTHDDFLQYEGEETERTINNVDEGNMSGPDYFANSKLEAWKLKYCLDNDTNRFDWADEVNGKGVIHRMIDEFNNDLSYDFKNIQFKRDDVYYFTFTWITEDDTIWDASIHPELTNDEGMGSRVFNNIILSAKENNSYILNDSVFIADYDTDGGIFYGWYWNTTKDYFVGNTIGDSFNYNTIGDGFYNNTIGDSFNYNTIGNGFNYNTVGNDFYNNTIGNGFKYNTIGNGFNYNTVGNDFYNNTIGDGFDYNTVGNGFNNNTIGSVFYYNTIGNSFNYNIIGSVFYYNTIGNYVRYIQFSVDGSWNNVIRYLYLKNGLSGASSANRLDLYYAGLYNREYPTTFERIANGNIISSWGETSSTRAGKVKVTNTSTTWSDITPSGTWKEVYSGTSPLLNTSGYITLTLNETAIYYNRPMMMEIKFGSNSDSYTHQIVTFNLGDYSWSTPTKFFPITVSVTDFDGRYLKTISVRVYVNTTIATNSLRVGPVKTLIGDFGDTPGTLTWTTEASDSLSVYIGKIWVLE